MACTNPFNTRDIEGPEIGDNSAIYKLPLEPEIVIETNFRYAIIQENISNYYNCFVDDPALAYNFVYKFVPDPSAETDKFRYWTLDDEKSYLNTVFFLSVNISLEFDEITYINISQSPDSVQTNSFRYELRIEFEEEDALFIGTARMKLIKDVNALWHIYYWEDTKSEDLERKSWSSLKATFKN